MKLLDISRLQIGDLIFWVNHNGQHAGHIAMIHKASSKPKHIRIIHATDSPRYAALCSTQLLSSHVLQPFNNHYEVIRCKDKKLLSEIFNLITFWTQYQPTFNQKKRLRMEEISTAFDITALNRRFREKQYADLLFKFHSRRHLPPIFLNEQENGFFCSSVFILALQLASIAHIHNVTSTNLSVVVPVEFQLDFELTSPTQLLNSLLRSNRFERLGEFQIEYDGYSDYLLRHLKKIWPQNSPTNIQEKQESTFNNLSNLIANYLTLDRLDGFMLEDERIQLRKNATECRTVFFSYFEKIPTNLKCQITLEEHPEANIIRSTLKQKLLGKKF